MSYEIFLMRVMHRTGLDDRHSAQNLTHHVVEHLARGLPHSDAEALSEQLPEPFASRLVDCAGGTEAKLDDLYHSVADRLGVDVSFGLEFTQVVLQVVGECLGRHGRARLHTRLDSSWQGLFEPRQATVPPQGHRNDDRRTLSSGEPGSSRSLSEAKPGHTNSIAHTEAPHLGTKLSTTHGKPHRRTLATGRPGSSRSIGGGGR